MRYPGATWIPSPNFGYPRGTHGQLKARIDSVDKSGEFWHSQAGRQSVTIGMFQNPATEVSAHFLVPKVGKPVQMVDSNDPAWHAGGFIANVYYHGFEFEGGPLSNPSELLTPSQIAWGVKITHWLRKVHGTPTRYIRRDTLWEHNEVKNTACPSGRIPWTKVIVALGEEEDMPLNTADKTWIKNTILAQTNAALVNTDKAIAAIQRSLRGGDLPGIYVRAKGQKTVYFVEFIGGVLVRHHVQNPATYIAIGGAGTGVIEVSVAQVNKMVLGPPLPNLKV
ncbi:hypothetical protein LCGC14_1998140 [marine sediment metagenome]|uniref:N-acetylmuramoyl-L-alanine amidase n=1 Tax=marine sediment metagenome TaxID=412755 RepID=A0A0F9F3U3_9ZZZZ